MPNPLPPLPPHMQKKVEELHQKADQILDGYVHGIELDMNRHAVKHGAMPPERAHHDLTRLLARDIPHNMMAAVLAAAILRGIAKKREGKA